MKTNIIECAADTNSTTSFRFKHGAKWDGKHKKISTKISVLSDINGLPADIEIDHGKIHDKDFLYLHIQNTAGKRKKVLNLDKVYVSIDLRRNMSKKGCHVNMEMRKGDYIRKKGPKFRFDKEKYKSRFQVERLFGWLENFKRLRIRQEYKLANFRGLVYLAAIIILLRN